jgi:hypothetical protein
VSVQALVEHFESVDYWVTYVEAMDTWVMSLNSGTTIAIQGPDEVKYLYSTITQKYAWEGYTRKQNKAKQKKVTRKMNKLAADALIWIAATDDVVFGEERGEIVVYHLDPRNKAEAIQ